MTKVYVYMGKENPKTIEHGTQFIARDLRPMSVCNNDNCQLNSKPQPSGKVISFGSDLHACKQNKDCRDIVSEKWEHLRKSFDPKSYLAERIAFHQEKGFSYEEATRYAKIDLDSKMNELKLKKKRLKDSDTNRKRASGILAASYRREGMNHREAMKRANEESLNMQKGEIEAFLELYDASKSN